MWLRLAFVITYDFLAQSMYSWRCGSPRHSDGEGKKRGGERGREGEGREGDVNNSVLSGLFFAICMSCQRVV